MNWWGKPHLCIRRCIMILEVEKRKGVFPRLKSNGKSVENVSFLNRYFCEHSQTWKSVFEVMEVAYVAEVKPSVAKRGIVKNGVEEVVIPMAKENVVKPATKKNKK